jgi:hypothetical protein
VTCQATVKILMLLQHSTLQHIAVAVEFCLVVRNNRLSIYQATAFVVVVVVLYCLVAKNNRLSMKD